MKKKTILKIILFIILFIIFAISLNLIGRVITKHFEQKGVQKPRNISEIYENKTLENQVQNEVQEIVLNENNAVFYEQRTSPKQLDDWSLTLVNYENQLPIDFEPTLSYIDSSRQIDSRVVDELKQMLKDMKKAGVKDIWVQSSYRSVKYQDELFNNKINEYMEYGETREDAEALTLKTINKPGTSEHNLGLAIDLNYVDYNFDKTKAYNWMVENAENYGFVLRYKKEKEEITKVDYEPWHWRYVGPEHARKMNELDMCLEEYVAYLLES